MMQQSPDRLHVCFRGKLVTVPIQDVEQLAGLRRLRQLLLIRGGLRGHGRGRFRPSALRDVVSVLV